MKNTLIAIVILICNASPGYSQKGFLKLEDIWASRKLTAKTVSGFNSMNNGEHYSKSVYTPIFKIEKYNFKDGKAIGEWKYYFENGSPLWVGNLIDSIPDGELKIFHENGQLKGIGVAKDGKRTGEFKLYHENGKLESVGKYFKFIPPHEVHTTLLVFI